MFTRLATGILIAIGAALILQTSAAAQGGNRPVRFPTPEQFEASAEAQRIIEEARRFVGDDLQEEYDNNCTFSGPQRAALDLAGDRAAGQERHAKTEHYHVLGGLDAVQGHLDLRYDARLTAHLVDKHEVG